MRKILAIFLLILVTSATVSAQRRRAVSAPKPAPVIFAVLNDGKTVEPIATIDKGALEKVADNSDEKATLLSFVRSYYKPKTAYRLVFGGVDAGSVTIVKNDPKAECIANMAEVTTVAPKAKLKGLVMGLATNDAVKKGNGYRRMPTASERITIETLVRAELTKQKVSAAAIEKLNYLNLTALDVDGDGKAEFVGTYWAATAPKERATLFIIADQDKSGKYKLGFSEYRLIKEDEVMNDDITSIEKGIYQQLLLDVMEFDGDTTDEIFTYTQGFEGSSFDVYSRREGKWEKAFEGANYHCGF